jgi:iron(III) transport system ATP-binding protein
MVQVDIDRVTKRFPAVRGGAETVAVDDVTLRVGAGSLFFLLGPSGCGKTTLLRMIAGFIVPSEGRILFDGRDVSEVPPHRRDTGMVFQSYALWPHMTVGENVAFGLDVRKVKEPERGRRVDEVLELVQMRGLKDRRPAQLSGGQQQRVALARALAVRPKVLLLDEPLSNLDAKLRLEMRSEIRRIVKATGTTAIYVTHDQKEALSMADGIAVMRGGRLEQMGTPEDLYRRPVSKFVAGFLGESNFLDGVVEGVEGETMRIRTAAGNVEAPAGGGQTVGEKVCVAFRPEAVRVVAVRARESAEGVVRLRGRRVGGTYLGEMAEHLVALEGGERVKAFEMNPRGGAEVGGEVSVEVGVGDVMVVGE